MDSWGSKQKTRTGRPVAWSDFPRTTVASGNGWRYGRQYGTRQGRAQVSWGYPGACWGQGLWDTWSECR